MKKLKKGSRVKVVKALFSADKPLVGKIGIVTEVQTGESQSICVRFNNWNNGHSGELPFDSANNRWYFNREALRLMPRRKKGVR